jgi:hypothetical protein
MSLFFFLIFNNFIFLLCCVCTIWIRIASDRLYSRSWHICSRWIEIEIRQFKF